MKNDKPYYYNKFSFRILGLTMNEIEKLKNKYHIELKNDMLRNTSISTVVIALDDVQICNTIERIIKEMNLFEKEYGIWASVVTELDSSGASFPEFISDLHHRIGGKIDFSFTVV
jgi:hypothetical protein